MSMNESKPVCSAAPSATAAAEVREIIINAALQKEAPEVGFGTQMANLFRGVGLKEGEEIKEIRGMRLQVPKF